MFLSKRYDVTGVGPMACLVLAFVASLGWKKDQQQFVSNSISFHKVINKIKIIMKMKLLKNMQLKIVIFLSVLLEKHCSILLYVLIIKNVYDVVL